MNPSGFYLATPHGYHVIGDVLMTLLASAVVAVIAVIGSELCDWRKRKGIARSDAE